jgi:hypothetical protein
MFTSGMEYTARYTSGTVWNVNCGCISDSIKYKPFKDIFSKIRIVYYWLMIIHRS